MPTAADELPAGPVVLRRWLLADAEAHHRAVTESLAHLAPWMPWAANGYTPADSREYLARCEQEWATGEAYGYAIRLPDGAIVGSCGLMARIGPGGLEIGYWVHPAHGGRGLATAAAEALTREAFRLGAEHVEIHHDAANTRSGGVPRRLGFTEVDRRPGPAERTPGESGVTVVWRRTGR